MKLFGEIFLGALVMCILGAVLVHCDVARAQSRPAGAITAAVARTIAASAATAPAVTRVTVESSVDWVVRGRALARTPDGCTEWRARRPSERTWYRIRICGFETTTLARIR